MFPHIYIVCIFSALYHICRVESTSTAIGGLRWKDEDVSMRCGVNNSEKITARWSKLSSDLTGRVNFFGIRFENGNIYECSAYLRNEKRLTVLPVWIQVKTPSLSNGNYVSETIFEGSFITHFNMTEGEDAAFPLKLSKNIDWIIDIRRENGALVDNNLFYWVYDTTVLLSRATLANRGTYILSLARRKLQSEEGVAFQIRIFLYVDVTPIKLPGSEGPIEPSFGCLHAARNPPIKLPINGGELQCNLINFIIDTIDLWKDCFAEETRNMTDACPKRIVKVIIHTVTGAIGAAAGATLGAFLGSFVGPIGTVIGAGVGAYLGCFTGHILGDLFTDYVLFPLVENYFEPVVNAAKEVTETFVSVAKDAAEVVTETFVSVKNEVTSIAKSAAKAVSSIVKNVAKKLCFFWC